jgi:hypothetical protein
MSAKTLYEKYAARQKQGYTDTPIDEVLRDLYQIVPRNQRPKLKQ